jgi:hypothetical protein
MLGDSKYFCFYQDKFISERIIKIRYASSNQREIFAGINKLQNDISENIWFLPAEGVLFYIKMDRFGLEQIHTKHVNKYMLRDLITEY